MKSEKIIHSQLKKSGRVGNRPGKEYGKLSSFNTLLINIIKKKLMFQCPVLYGVVWFCQSTEKVEHDSADTLKKFKRKTKLLISSHQAYSVLLKEDKDILKGLVLEPINMAGKGPLTTSPFSLPDCPSGKFKPHRSVLEPQFHRKLLSLLIALKLGIKKWQQNGEDWGNLSREPCSFSQVLDL